jgi:putative ABC transport system permease protein
VVGLAVAAVAIGAALASALLHLGSGAGRDVAVTMRALGPNLVIAGPPAAGGSSAFVDEALRARMLAEGADVVPLLYVAGRVGSVNVAITGTDLDAARRLHPTWQLTPEQGEAWMGARLMKRLGVSPGHVLDVEVKSADGQMTRARLPVGAKLVAGGPEDDAWWIPLAEAQRLAALPGKVSMFQARVPGDAAKLSAVAARIGARGDLEALPLTARSATEDRLLDRVRRLLLLVTVAALAAAMLGAYGTLTDLALERRRDIALMKALGATPRDVAEQFAAESLVLGLLGGVTGWLLGLWLAMWIALRVFHTAVTPQLASFAGVLALAVVVAGLASVGPIRLALAVDPAPLLKQED